MIHVMDLKPDDHVLVITDKKTERIGRAFYQAAEQYGCTADLFDIPNSNRPLKTVPQPMLDKLDGTTVAINAFASMQEETPFRIQWIKQILATGRIRLGHGPGITEAMMIDGPMNVDYAGMLATAVRLSDAFTNAASVHITALAGTDVTVYIEDRPFANDIKITTEHFGNLPCGEIWCAPVENRGDGLIVCDGSIGDIGNVTEPLHITIRNGKITELISNDDKLVKQVQALLKIDPEASVIGELGIGLNAGAKLTGNLLEDEKAFNTAHIAFGNNEEMAGGQNKSKTHRDFLFYKPTFTVTYKDGSQRTLIKDGTIQI